MLGCWDGAGGLGFAVAPVVGDWGVPGLVGLLGVMQRRFWRWGAGVCGSAFGAGVLGFAVAPGVGDYLSSLIAPPTAVPAALLLRP